MIDWPLALTTASHAIKLAQDLRQIDKEIGQAELKLKVADLTSALADLKLTLTEAKSEAADKDAEIARLKQLHRKIVEDSVEVNGYLFRKATNREGPAGNPYCPVCFQKAGLLFELADTQLSGRPIRCPSCTALYSNVPTFTD